jgi:hypothetical protein
MSVPATQSVDSPARASFCKITYVSIHSFVEWMDTFSYELRLVDVPIKELNHIRRFVIDIAKDLMLLSCRLAMEYLCVLQLEKALATLVTHGLHWPTVDEGLDTAALTSVYLMRFE